MTEEIWQDIEEYKGHYEISNQLRVRGVPRTVITKRGGRVIKGRILTKIKLKNGYIYVALTKEGKTKRILFHRLVAMTFIPNPNNYPVINHKDSNPSNNTLENLEWCTQSHNIQHAFTTGRKTQFRGSESTNAKLDELQVLTIKYLLKSTEVSQAAIARYFKVSTGAIRAIHIGNNWKHIKLP